jgi:hypothetical protein
MGTYYQTDAVTANSPASISLSINTTASLNFQATWTIVYSVTASGAATLAKLQIGGLTYQ